MISESLFAPSPSPVNPTGHGGLTSMEWLIVYIAVPIIVFVAILLLLIALCICIWYLWKKRRTAGYQRLPGGSYTGPSITSHPVSQTDVVPGSGVQFSVTATGTGPLRCQWQRDGVNLTDGGRITGATTATLSITAVQKSDEGGYACVVTNTAGTHSHTSNAANLKLESKAQRIGGKVSDAVKNVVHKTATHSKDLLGIKSDETLEGKKWYLGKVSNQDAESKLMKDSDGSYVVYDHPDCENSFVLLVWWKDKVHKLSINGLDNEGREKMEYVVGDDVNQKKHSTVKALIKYHRGATGIAIQLEDGTRITLKKFTAAAPPQVTPHPESQTDILPGSDMPATGIKPSQDGPPQATVTVHQTSTPPQVTSHPESQTDVKPGSKVVFTVTATGTEPLSYQWQKDGVNLTDGSSIRGTTTAKMTIAAVQKGDEGGYACVVSNTAGTVTSKPATLDLVTQAEVLTGKTWYPGNISYQEAVSRLMEDSDRSDGSYVVYDHPDRKNSFVLLVWWKGLVHKLSINEVWSTDDEGREKVEYALGEDVNEKKHSTVKALIKYHRGVTGKQTSIQLKDGTRITLKKSIARDRVVDKRWYHGNISDEEAESRLRRGCGGKDGTYLVYDNPSGREGSYMYVLAYYQGDIIKEPEMEINRLKCEGEKFGYVLGEGGPGAIVHSSVKELVKYHRGLTGVPIQLKDGRKVKLTEHVYLK